MAPAATATVRAIKRDVPFTWEGKDKRGARVKGKSLAPDEATLRAELRRQGVAPSRIRKQRQMRGGGKVNAGDIAVFYRTNAQSRVIEEELVRRSIPYKVIGGTRFYDRKEIL